MATAPGKVGIGDEGIDAEDKLKADLLDLLIERKLNIQEAGKNSYKVSVSNMEKISEHILPIVENRYKALGWGTAKIKEEPRSYQDTPGSDPYIYTVTLIK